MNFKSVLGFAWVYQLYQWLVGAHKYLRLFAEDYILYREGEKILDIGCGPADILKFLPPNARYTGIDLSRDYILKAREAHPGKTFIQGDIASPDFPLEDETFDTVFFIGVQHHLPDEVVAKMLNFGFRKLKKGGRMLSLEPVYAGRQGLLERFIMRNDRGKFIRTVEEYQALTNPVFKKNRFEVIPGTMNIPFTIIITQAKR